MTVLLAMPQNETHVESLRQLIPALSVRGVTIRLLDLRRVYDQEIDLESLEAEIVTPRVADRTAFYRSGPLERAKIVLHMWRPVEAAVDETGGVFAFNDGAIQRVALRRARQRGGATFLLLDGMISEYREASKSDSFRVLLQRMGRLLGGTPAAAFLPSEVGMAPVDVIFVIGEHSASVLRRRGARAKDIIPSGLPRWTDRGARQSFPSNVRRILYLTGAFAWHADAATGVAQVSDVGILWAVCRRLGIQLAVRVHPRDDPAPYDGIGELIDPASEPLAASISWSDEVVSLVSTGMLEAISLGRPARVLCITPAWHRFEKSFAADPMFMRVQTEEQLESALVADASHLVPEIEARQQDGLSRYVAAEGPAAVERIVDVVASLVGGP
jgi:hypothetical protein